MLSFKPGFHSSLSPLSRGSLVPLHFLPLQFCHLYIWGCCYLSWQSWFQLVSQAAQYFTWCTLHRWRHPCVRKWRTKELLGEGERGEWKSWLKTRHPKNKDHSIHSHHSMANRREIIGNSDRLCFLGLRSHCRWWLQPWKTLTSSLEGELWYN